jgi:hypothetical protein
VAALSRAEETVFRMTAAGRQPVAAAADSQNHIFYSEPRTSAGIGCITSRRKTESVNEIILRSRLQQKGEIK